MPIHSDFQSIYSENHQIQFVQCYPNKKIKYNEICNLFQMTASNHADKGGISFTDMQQYHQAWVMTKMRIEIYDLPEWNETVEVRTWIANMESQKHSSRQLAMYRNGKIIIGASSSWSVLNTALRKVEEIALPINQFELYPENKATQKDLENRLSIFTPSISIEEKEVKISDLDIVNHMNNTKYLEWCLDTLNPETILDSKINALEMNFLRELSWGDKASIEHDQKNTPETILIKKNNKVCFALHLDIKS